jgi:LAO/AO transport system kinase
MRGLLSLDAYITGIRSGNRMVLGKAITLIESSLPEHSALAGDLLTALLQQPPEHAALRIAITGAPGVVLAIDPSSALSGGSIMGDKTRMEHLSVSDRAFIRPSPSGDTLGGVAHKTRETILLTEAAGYDVVLIETVGVGQSEIAARHMTDLFVLLLLPGAGDELQGIKRGIVEMADLLVVNKADGDRIPLANQARAHYLNATHLLPPQKSGWTPRVLSCSAAEHVGIEAVWTAVEAYRTAVEANGYFDANRREQAQYWFKERIAAELQTVFYSHPDVQAALQHIEPKVLNGQISPFVAAAMVLKAFGTTDDKP